MALVKKEFKKGENIYNRGSEYDSKSLRYSHMKIEGLYIYLCNLYRKCFAFILYCCYKHFMCILFSCCQLCWVKLQLYVVYGVKHLLSLFFFFRNEIDPDNPSHSQYAQSLVSQLIQEIENKALSYANNEDLFLVRMRLDEAATSFKVMLWNSW